MSSPGPISLSFGGPARKTRRLDLHDAEKRVEKQEILGFDESGIIQTASTSGAKEEAADKLVISAQPNTYRAGQQFRPSYIPQAADQAEEGGINKFETAEHDTAEAQTEVVYGLIQRDRPERNGGTADAEAQALRRDLQVLPAATSLEQYEAMPVDSFATALLRGMGWQEGAGVGPAGKAAPEPQEIKRRPTRLGLGASGVPLPATHKKFIKPGEKRMENSTGSAASRPDASQLQRARVVAGKHAGSACLIERWEPKQEGRSARATVRILDAGNERVSVRASELSVAVDAPSSRAASRPKSVAQTSTSGRESASSSPWVVRGIRVKVVDESLDSYLKKGVVVSITHEPRRCSVRLDSSGRILEGLRQSQLETVVPSTSDLSVLVVGPQSRYRGLQGHVVHRDVRNGTVQLRLGSSDKEGVKEVSMDDVAELVSTD